MIPDYQFFLDNGNGLGQSVAHPIWKDDLSVELSYESNQLFKRTQLSGNLVFVGADFDYIMDADFEDAIELEVLASYNNGGTWVTLYTGEFHLTDCEINEDDKKITVKAQIKDRYSKVLAGLDKEYDLIKLNPAIQPVTMTRRPMIQIYVPGDSVVSCFLSNMQWEQDANEEDDYGKLINDYHFSKIGTYVELNFTGSVLPDLASTFVGSWITTNEEGEWLAFENETHVYYITYFQRKEEYQAGYKYYNGLRIYKYDDPTTKCYEYEQDDGEDGWDQINTPFTMSSLRSHYADQVGEYINTDIFGRFCLASETFAGNDTYPIQTDDIVPYNRNYRYCYPFGRDNTVKITYNSSADPTQWGIRSDGRYFDKPTPELGVIDFLPVARTSWINASLWFCQSPETEALEVLGRKATVLRDAFTLEAVINALLSEIDPTVTFAATTDYSTFLYGQNPLMVVGWGRLVMTPKSNVLVAEYSQPARKAPVTLGQVLNMLKNACGCYWFIDSQNRLRIEHISWFKNGGSYTGQPTVGLDITNLYCKRNGKSIAYGTNSYKYEKMEMPERYEYAWMDDTTDTFKGQAIEVLSDFVDKGQIEDITIENFNADLDYMMLNPSAVSEDGFALLCCTIENGIYKTTIARAYGLTNKVQNHQLAMVLLQPAFLISDMPSWNIKVNGSAVTAKGIQRKKQQELNIPLGLSSLNAEQMVKTGIGTGEIKSASIKLSSRMTKLILIYDTTTEPE